MNTQTWALHENCAPESEILAHLIRCNARFVPPLSSRVDLPAYAKRLFDKASRFEAWFDNQLIGLVAVYFETSQDHAAFISNVSVEEGYLGRGIASMLLEHAITRAGTMRSHSISLRVYAANAAARNLYAKYGFQPFPDGTDQIFMQRDLREPIP